VRHALGAERARSVRRPCACVDRQYAPVADGLLDTVDELLEKWHETDLESSRSVREFGRYLVSIAFDSIGVEGS